MKISCSCLRMLARYEAKILNKQLITNLNVPFFLQRVHRYKKCTFHPNHILRDPFIIFNGRKSNFGRKCQRGVYLGLTTSKYP